MFIKKYSMKFLKKFESLTEPSSYDPQRGNYVIVKPNNSLGKAMNNFFKNNVGIVDSYYQGNPNYWYRIKFINIPEELKTGFITFNKKDFLYLCQLEDIRFALPKDIEEWQFQTDINKYNL